MRKIRDTLKNSTKYPSKTAGFGIHFSEKHPKIDRFPNGGGAISCLLAPPLERVVYFKN